MKKLFKFITTSIYAYIVLINTAIAQPVEISIATFNTESASDTQPYKVAELIRNTEGVYLWAFQEVSGADALEEYTVAAASAPKTGRDGFRAILSESGVYRQQHRRDDYLALVYNSTEFRQVETIELHGLRSRPGAGRLGDADWRARGALLLRLQHKDTGIEFYFGTVHLKCCTSGKPIRAHQTTILSDWIKEIKIPVIIAGDFNIPIEPDEVDDDHSLTSDAFKNMVSPGVTIWGKPTNPITTQCDDSFSSMLDHIFIKEGVNVELDEVVILQDQPEFCDLDEQGYADHRPVMGIIVIQP